MKSENVFSNQTEVYTSCNKRHKDSETLYFLTLTNPTCK